MWPDPSVLVGDGEPLGLRGHQPIRLRQAVLRRPLEPGLCPEAAVMRRHAGPGLDCGVG
jgi:hypothetical protein